MGLTGYCIIGIQPRIVSHQRVSQRHFFHIDYCSLLLFGIDWSWSEPKPKLPDKSNIWLKFQFKRSRPWHSTLSVSTDLSDLAQPQLLILMEFREPNHPDFGLMSGVGHMHKSWCPAVSSERARTKPPHISSTGASKDHVCQHFFPLI